MNQPHDVIDWQTMIRKNPYGSPDPHTKYWDAVPNIHEVETLQRVATSSHINPRAHLFHQCVSVRATIFYNTAPMYIVIYILREFCYTHMYTL